MKKHRNITVNGEEWVYTIKNNVDGDGNNRVRIINKASKKTLEYLLRGTFNITPKIISDLICNKMDKEVVIQ